MSEQIVQIVKLEPLRAARFHGFGEQPEDLAWQQLAAWAQPKGLLDFSAAHCIFGFNHPSPAPGSPNYGYEFWLTLSPEEESSDVEMVDFAGGLYAVTRCVVRDDPGEVIPAAWKRLVAWCENSPYQSATHQWLERHIQNDVPGENFTLDLYLPIAE